MDNVTNNNQNNNNNRTSGDGQSSPDLTDRKYASFDYQQQTLITETLESSILLERDLTRNQRKFFYLIEKVKKRKTKLKELREKLDIRYEFDNDSEFEGIEFAINQPANSFINNHETNNAGSSATMFNTNNDETNYNSKLARANETMNTSTGTSSEKLRQIVSHCHCLFSFKNFILFSKKPSKKFYDIRRIPPLLKFDDPLENVS